MGGQVFDIADRDCWVEPAIEIREKYPKLGESYDEWFAKGRDIVWDFMSKWTAVRAYHGCSTSNVGQYYEHGILPLNVEAANSAVYDIFLGQKIPRADIERAIEKHKDQLETRRGRTYVELNRKVLLEQCGHYLIYGSEYVHGIAATLEKDIGKPCREFLRTRGRPTLLVCDLPVETITKSTIIELGCLLVSRNGSPSEVFYQMLSTTFGVSFRERISPRAIISHVELAEVFDPLTRTMRKY